MTRLDQRRVPELMDRREADPDQLRRSLADLRAVNRWLGGRRTATALLLDLAGRISARPVRVLDVGTGGADIPLALARQARRQGVEMRILATDIHPGTLEFARRAAAHEPAVQIGAANALHLPFEEDAFDLAMCCTTLHHFGREDARRVLAELDRVARFGFVVTDLARSWSAFLGARLLAATLWRRHPITRHDGPASVRAAFTAEELGSLANGVVAGSAEVRRHPLFRLSLAVDRSEGRR